MNNLAGILPGKQQSVKKAGLQISVLLLLCSLTAGAQSSYSLTWVGADSASAALLPRLTLTRSFVSRESCQFYLQQVPVLLQGMGYVTASLDSVQYDSAGARAVVYLGRTYRWARLETSGLEPALRQTLGGGVRKQAPLRGDEVQRWQQQLLDYCENHGYPFARIWLDSVRIAGDSVFASLRADKGFVYKIDSIRQFGKAKIAAHFLHRYLDIPPGSPYNRQKLSTVSQRLRELPYLEEEQPFRLSLLSTGALLDLYLKPRKSSQINLLVGFLPNNNQLASRKMLITGEGLLNLRNALGAGETIGLSFQALQVESQRLNLLYNHPFLFRSPVGLDFQLEMFRKDSSFVNIQLQAGATYLLNARQSGKLFLQRFQTIVSEGGFNRQQIIQTRRLPSNLDVNSVAAGIDYDYNGTDYRPNPLRGFELRFTGSAGTKKVKRNNLVQEIKDPADPGFDFGRLYDTLRLNTYQLRLRLMAARYWPLANQRSTVKTGLNAGFFQSGNVFRNELFQIGGYKMLRGFDEESQYLSGFAIATAEYRYLVGVNSYLYVLLDGGWGQDNSGERTLNYGYLGTGLGMAFETKAGVFNLAWAVGKRNDSEFSLRQSKIHFGFVNYF